MSRTTLCRWAALGAAFAVAAVVRLSSLSLGEVLDDSFMYMDTARTLGTTGHLSTSGIQPLYLLLLTPLYAALRPETVAQLDVAAYASLVVAALGDLVAMALLARLLWKLGGPTAAVVGAWLWALHPGAVAYAENGLETSWALAAMIGVAIAADGRRDRLTGATVAAAMLARIDMAAAGVAVGVFALWDSRHEPKVALARAARLAGGWAVVYVPWLAFLFAQTGDLVPVSGPATHLLGAPHRAAAAAELGFPFTVLMFGLACEAIAFSAPLVTVGAVAGLGRVDFRRVRVLLATAAIVLTFYVTVHQVSWYLPRYVAPALVVEVVLCALAASTLRPLARGVVVGAGLAYAAYCTLAVPAPPAFDARAAAVEMREKAGPGTFAAPESGALSYYMPGQILNADGVTDRSAYAAMRDGRLERYLRSRGADRIISRRYASRVIPDFSEPFSTTRVLSGERGYNVDRVDD